LTVNIQYHITVLPPTPHMLLCTQHQLQQTHWEFCPCIFVTQNWF